MLNENSENKKKSALAVVAGPWRLIQVLWLTYVYCDYEWDIVIKRYGKDLQLMDEIEEQCKKSGRFRHIYNSKSSAISSFSSFSDLSKEFFKMLFYYCIGNRKLYCRKLIQHVVDDFQYDMLCVACSYSILEGAVLNFSDEIETHVIEEGIRDYFTSEYASNLMQKIVGNLVKGMGYANINHDSDFKLYQNCIKWASSPEELLYKKWKVTRKLFDPALTNFKAYTDKLYEIYNIEKTNYDLIIFTSPLIEWGKDDGLPELHSWISENYHEKKILIKKHPRDEEKYEWTDLNIDIKYTSVPGEVILKCFSDVSEFIFVFISSIYLSVDQDSVKYKVCKFTKNVDDRYIQAIDGAIEQWNILDQNILYL